MACATRLDARRPGRTDAYATAKSKMPLPRLEIPRLRRGERREQAAVGLEVDQRRHIQAIEAPHLEDRPFARYERGERRPDRVRPDRRAQRKRAPRRPIVGRALAHEVATRLVQPIEDLDPL